MICLALIGTRIESYAAYFARRLDRHLGDTTRDPIKPIEAFADDAANGMERFDFKRGCLVGNLSQELAALDETFRAALLNVIRDWQTAVM